MALFEKKLKIKLEDIFVFINPQNNLLNSFLNDPKVPVHVGFKFGPIARKLQSDYDEIVKQQKKIISKHTLKDEETGESKFDSETADAEWKEFLQNTEIYDFELIDLNLLNVDGLTITPNVMKYLGYFFKSE